MVWWVIMLDVVVFFYCGRKALLWWVIMLDLVVFLLTVVDKHYCGGLLCLLGYYV